MKNVDIVIISNAKNDLLLWETHKAIDSLYESEREILFNVYVVESNHEVNYDSYRFLSDKHRNVVTIHTTEPFGYHKYLNIGRRAGNSEYVVLCNNDLIFGKNWASTAIEQMEKYDIWSAGCVNPNKSNHKDLLESNIDIKYGYGVSNEVTGWCIFQKREIYNHIGDLDERFDFWYCDNWYAHHLQKLGFYHILVCKSIVYHHNITEGSTLRREEDIERKEKLTNGGREIYEQVLKET